MLANLDCAYEDIDLMLNTKQRLLIRNGFCPMSPKLTQRNTAEPLKVNICLSSDPTE